MNIIYVLVVVHMVGGMEVNNPIGETASMQSCQTLMAMVEKSPGAPGYPVGAKLKCVEASQTVMYQHKESGR